MSDLDEGSLDDNPSDPLPWERQGGETPRQFAFFSEYRDMHPLERSLAKVGRMLGVSTSYVERLSSTLQWAQRVAAWDNAQDRATRARRSALAERMNEHLSRIASAALIKIEVAVDALDPSRLKPNEIARLLETVSRATRGALGTPQDDVEGPQATLPNADDLRRFLKREGFFSGHNDQ